MLRSCLPIYTCYCTFVFAYLHVNVFVFCGYVRIYAHVFRCVHMHMCLCAYICACIFVSIYVHVLVCMRVCMCLCACAHTCVRVRLHVGRHTFGFVCPSGAFMTIAEINTLCRCTRAKYIFPFDRLARSSSYSQWSIQTTRSSPNISSSLLLHNNKPIIGRTHK